jgi:hypothetical protein
MKLFALLTLAILTHSSSPGRRAVARIRCNQLERDPGEPPRVFFLYGLDYGSA